MTQTKLQSFFKKPSNENESPTMSEFESDDDGNLVIDEEPGSKYDDTTLKLEENDNLDMHNNTTLKINETLEEEQNKHNSSKTFVINITLKGIPSKDKQEKAPDKHHRNYKEKSSAKSPQKAKPVAKRKIKALFGDSSESDEECAIPKKKKKDEKKENKSKVEEKRSSKEHKKRHKSTSSKEKDTNQKENLFGNISDDESEKQLVVDIESQKNHSKSKDDIVEKSTVQLKEKSSDHVESKKEDRRLDPVDNSDTGHIISEKPDSSIESCNSALLEMDDDELDKAHKLSKEADKVLMSLKQFAEQVHEPIVVEKSNKEKDVNPSSQPQKSSQSPTKHKLSKSKESTSIHKSSLSLNRSKDKHKHAKEKGKSEDKVKIEKPKKKEEIAVKKTEKVDVAGLVVRLLMPYYKNKKISSRDLFKITARHIVHQLLAIQVTGKEQ